MGTFTFFRALKTLPILKLSSEQIENKISAIPDLKGVSIPNLNETLQNINENLLVDFFINNGKFSFRNIFIRV